MEKKPNKTGRSLVPLQRFCYVAARACRCVWLELPHLQGSFLIRQPSTVTQPRELSRSGWESLVCVYQ